MSRIVEGIKGLLKGKDNDDHEYRYRYDQRGALGSNRYDEYPTNASLEGRSGYYADERSNYPVTAIGNGQSGYAGNLIPDGRSSFPPKGRNDYIIDGRNGYPAEGRSGYPATTTAIVDGHNGYSTSSILGAQTYPIEGRNAHGIEGHSGYPISPTIDGRSEYLADPLAKGHSTYPNESRSGYPIEGRNTYPIEGYRTYSTEGRNAYPIEGRSAYPIEGRGAYPSEGRSAYPTEGRSAYPTEGRNAYPSEGRNAYPTEGRNAYPTEGRRNAYPTEGRSAYPIEGRSAYPSEGQSAFPSEGHNTYPTEGRSGYSTDGRSGYPTDVTAGGYQVPLGRQAVDDDYIRSSYDTRSEARGKYRQPYASSPRGSKDGEAYGIRDASPRASSKFHATPHVEIPPRGEYVRTTQPSPREYRSPASGGSMVELMVPMCCDKCKEKVQEELRDVDGVDSVRCDPKNSRVIVTGDQFIDIERCLTKAERAVKKKCELVSNQADGGTPNSKKVTSPSGYYETVAKSGILAPPTVSSSRGSPSGRPTLVRMPSFASGKVTQYDGVGPRSQDYEAKDYNGFRRMPSLGKSRHHEAEYISSYNEQSGPRASSQRDFNAPIRRMPSFNRSRHHDAEYMAAVDDRDYSPRSFYDNSSSYTASYNDRPNLLSQVSFSKIPVENPNYVKQITNF